MIIETCHQLEFPLLKLDTKSEICRDPYAYLKHLVTSLQIDADDTIWLEFENYKVSIAADRDLEIPQTTEPPFVCVSVWPDKSNESCTPESFVVGPQGTIYTHQPQERIGRPSIISSYIIPAPMGIEWLNDAHQHAAAVALFIDDIVPKNRSS